MWAEQRGRPHHTFGTVSSHLPCPAAGAAVATLWGRLTGQEAADSAPLCSRATPYPSQLQCTAWSLSGFHQCLYCELRRGLSPLPGTCPPACGWAQQTFTKAHDTNLLLLGHVYVFTSSLPLPALRRLSSSLGPLFLCFSVQHPPCFLE